LNVLADRSTESGHQCSSDVIALNFQNLQKFILTKILSSPQ